MHFWQNHATCNLLVTEVVKLQTALKVAGHKNSVSRHHSLLGPPFISHSATLKGSLKLFTGLIMTTQYGTLELSGNP